jgi:hypothetical protein
MLLFVTVNEIVQLVIFISIHLVLHSMIISVQEINKRGWEDRTT